MDPDRLDSNASTDMYEEDGNLVIETELPGMKVEDIEVKLEGDRLTLRAEKKEESRKDARHHARERYYGEYYRTFTLPFHVREDEVKARYQDGILEVVLPRSEKDQTRKIKIKGPPEKKQVAQGAKKAKQIHKA